VEGWCEMGFSQILKSVLGKDDKDGSYQYSYNPKDQTYTQISSPENSDGSPIKGIMGAVKRMLGKGNNDSSGYQYSFNPQDQSYTQIKGPGMKKGGRVKMSSASKRADGIAMRGKTKGRIV